MSRVKQNTKEGTDKYIFTAGLKLLILTIK